MSWSSFLSASSNSDFASSGNENIKIPQPEVQNFSDVDSDTEQEDFPADADTAVSTTASSNQQKNSTKSSVKGPTDLS